MSSLGERLCVVCLVNMDPGEGRKRELHPSPFSLDPLTLHVPRHTGGCGREGGKVTTHFRLG